MDPVCKFDSVVLWFPIYITFTNYAEGNLLFP